MENKSNTIFGNQLDAQTVRKAQKAKDSYVKRFGDDAGQPCRLRAAAAPAIGKALGVRQLLPEGASAAPFDLYADAQAAGTDDPVVVGNIRMGFGHYRIAMAMASAARALGYTPYWHDLMAFPATTCSKVISYQNDLYSMGSRLSQKSRLFNKLYWEPMNSEGFRRLSYNASDQRVSELMCAPFEELPRDVPYIGTHAWTAQAAVHSGMKRVVNAIPDNWPMALHLAEGAPHAVQTPKCYEGYRKLDGFDPKHTLSPMPDDAIAYVGNFVDHELVANIPFDCTRRETRLETVRPIRYLLSVGGAGAQQKLFCRIVEHLVPYVDAGKASVLINVGDHRGVWRELVDSIPALSLTTCHFDDFKETAAFAEGILDGPCEGFHAFCHRDTFSAVYSTNLLMRGADILATKPGELSFYPVPKLMLPRVGGHEAWGAIRAAELGDGTLELADAKTACDAIDLLQADPAPIAAMCANIRANDADGIYNGAYRVVQLACGMEA